MNRKTIKLPKKFAKYFWDCDLKDLKIVKYPQFILGRLMHLGGEKAIFWILANYSPADVKRVLNSRSCKGQLDKRSFVFWVKLSKTKNIWN